MRNIIRVYLPNPDYFRVNRIVDWTGAPVVERDAGLVRVA